MIERLQTLADKTGRTKSFYAREAILRYLEDMEDTFIAIERLENPQCCKDLFRSNNIGT